MGDPHGEEIDAAIARLESENEVREMAAALELAQRRHRNQLYSAMVRLRQSVGMSLADVARKMGTSQPAVARFEAGLTDPKLSTLERYAAAIFQEVHFDWKQLRLTPAVTDSTTQREGDLYGVDASADRMSTLAGLTCQVNVYVNGQQYSSEVEPRLLLVHYLRDVLGLTGTHIGCDTSQCGACTIDLNGRSVKSCTLFAVQADGHYIRTIEGMANPDGTLHPIQQAFIEEHGLQCGYCTPGFIMAAADLLERTPNPSEDDIKKGIEGNLCRCTGYVNIIKAIKRAAIKMGQGDLEELVAPAAWETWVSRLG